MPRTFLRCAAAISVAALASSIATPSDAGGWSRDRGRAAGPIAAVAGATYAARTGACGLFGWLGSRRSTTPAVAGYTSRRAAIAPPATVVPVRRQRTGLMGWFSGRRTTTAAVATRRPVVAAAVTTAPRRTDRGLFGLRMDRRR
jgi:hypothetical protein